MAKDSRNDSKNARQDKPGTQPSVTRESIPSSQPQKKQSGK